MLGSCLVSAIASLFLLAVDVSRYLVTVASLTSVRPLCSTAQGIRHLVASPIRLAGTLFIGGALVAVPLLGRATDAAPTTPINKTIELLVTTAPGAPTSQQIVDYYANPMGPPPLRSLAAEHPVRVDYLLQERAEGDALA